MKQENEGDERNETQKSTKRMQGKKNEARKWRKKKERGYENM